MKSEEFLLDDSFLAWYFRSDEDHWKHWEELRKKDPVLRGQMEEAGKIIDAIISGNIQVGAHREAAARVRLMSRIQAWENTRRSGKAGTFGRRHWLWSGLAASVVLLVAIAYGLLVGPGKDQYYAESGNARRIELPDGSVVNLNGSSSMKTSFAKGKDREVWLDGEAYFKVARMTSGHKFIVHTGDLDVEVLGTEFNIRGNAERTEVVLESGKVQLSIPEASADKVVMQPGELAEFSKTSRTITKRDVNTKIYTSWKEGKVIFENAGVDEIAEALRDRYGLQVEVETGTVLGEFNGIFPSDDSEIVLTALEKTYTGRIVRRENSVVIKK